MRKGLRKKQDILDTAAQLFAQKGYLNTSIQDILDLLNCSKGSFYHHFKTKFEVLAEIARERAQKALLGFQKTQNISPIPALNHLLFLSAHFSLEDRPLIDSLLALDGEFEGAALLSVMQEAVMEAFYPPFALLTTGLSKLNQAVFQNEGSLKLAFAGFLAGSAQLHFEKSPEKQLMLLRALRKQTEVCLGLTPGSIVIIEYDELQK